MDGGATLFFAIFSKDFPVVSEPLLVIEDRPAETPAIFGELGDVWFGSPRGLKRYDRTSLEADTLTQASRTLDALRIDAAGHAAYRATASVGAGSRQAEEERKRTVKALGWVAASRADLLQTTAELAERLGPQFEDMGTTLAALLASRSAPPSPPSQPHPVGKEGEGTSIALSDSRPTTSNPTSAGPSAAGAGLTVTRTP